MAESEEALQLKRRARRRLVGAIALVTFVVIILPLVLDKKPGPAGPPLEVQIPRQESSGFTSRVAPPAPQVPAAPATEKKTEIPFVKAGPGPVEAETPPAKSEPEQAAQTAKAAEKANAAEKAKATAAAKAQALPTERNEPGQAQAAPGNQTWAVTLGAFSNAKNVNQLRSKLSAARVKSYTETVKNSKGESTRVRAGPFASREAAEKARSKLEAMGLRPGAVTSR